MVRAFCVWPGMGLSQRQVSLVVSDWESYLGSLSHLCGVGDLCCVFLHRTGLFVCRFVVFPVFSCFIKKYEHLPHCPLVLLFFHHRQVLQNHSVNQLGCAQNGTLYSRALCALVKSKGPCREWFRASFLCGEIQGVSRLLQVQHNNTNTPDSTNQLPHQDLD